VAKIDHSRPFSNGRNGLSVPPALKPHTILDIASRPGWAARMLTAKRWTFGNLAGHLKDEDNVKAVAEWVSHQFDQSLSWSDVDWIRSLWPGKLIMKGILNVDAARSAGKARADVIVVANYGGLPSLRRRIAAKVESPTRCPLQILTKIGAPV